MTTEHEEDRAEGSTSSAEIPVEPAPEQSITSNPTFLVERMVASGEWPDPELLQQIFDQGEASVKPLVEILNTRPSGWPQEAPLCHAAGLLSMLRPPSALPALCEAARFYKNDTTQNLAAAISSYGPTGLDALIDLIRDPAVSGYQRCDLIDGARQAAGDDPVQKARLAEVLRELFTELVRESHADERFESELLAAADEQTQAEAGADVDLHGVPIEEMNEEKFDRLAEAEGESAQASQGIDKPTSDERGQIPDQDELDNEINRDEDLAFLTNDLAGLADPLARDMILAAFEEELIDESIINRKEVDQIYASGGQAYSPPVTWLQEYAEFYRGRKEEEQRLARMPAVEFPTRVSYPPPETSQSHAPPPGAQPVEPFRHTAPKIGRNDPCWCGSGKKYKKCHLGKDAPA